MDRYFTAAVKFAKSLISVADPAISGLGGQPPPHWAAGLPPRTKTLGWSWLHEAGCLRHGGKFSFKSLTFGHFFVWKWIKSFQLCPLDGPCWGLCPRSPFRLALCALAMVCPPFGKSWICHWLSSVTHSFLSMLQNWLKIAVQHFNAQTVCTSLSLS